MSSSPPNPEYRALLRRIAAEFRVPNEAPHPLFVQADFGLVDGPGRRLRTKISRDPGLPIALRFSAGARRVYREVYSLPPNLHRSWTASIRQLSPPSDAAIVGDHDPQETVLLEIQPLQQKTLCDFCLTEKHALVHPHVSVSDVEKRGRELYAGGKRIRRIYNRVIVDELVRTRPPMNFRFTDDLDVEWAGHPNWFFRLEQVFAALVPARMCTAERSSCPICTDCPESRRVCVEAVIFVCGPRACRLGPARKRLRPSRPRTRATTSCRKKCTSSPAVDTPAGPTKIEDPDHVYLGWRA